MGLLYTIYQSLHENNDRTVEEERYDASLQSESELSLISLLLKPIRDERMNETAGKP